MAALAAADFLGSIALKIDTEFSPVKVLAGEDVTALVTRKSSKVDIGNGLRLARESVVCTTAGTLRYRPPAHFYVEEKSRKQYYPREGDQVVGIVEDRAGEAYRINIFSGQPAIMSTMAFDGASKRNKPDLKKGDIVYCRVQSARGDVDVEVTCMAASGVKKDWSSGEAVYGGLSQGLLSHVSIYLAHKLLHPDSVILKSLGEKLAYEIAIGMNGALWLKGGTIAETVLIKNAIENSQNLSDDQIVAMVAYLSERVEKK